MARDIFQLLHLYISLNMLVVKNINSLTLARDSDIDKKKLSVSNEVWLGFTQVMGLYLCICEDRKIFSSKVCIKLQCDRICFSGRKKYSLKVVNIQITIPMTCHFSLFKNLSIAVISHFICWYCKLYTSITFFLFS